MSKFWKAVRNLFCQHRNPKLISITVNEWNLRGIFEYECPDCGATYEERD